ncbi:hypothetical protein, partial [Paraglaciecola sp.]
YMQLVNYIDFVAAAPCCFNRSALKRGRIIETTHSYATLYFIYFTVRSKTTQTGYKAVYFKEMLLD